MHICVTAVGVNKGFGTVYYFIICVSSLIHHDLFKNSFTGNNVFKLVCTVACSYLF